MDKKTKIAVVMGGPSSEAEVSRHTGTAILQALLSKGYNAVGLELKPKTLVNDLLSQKIEVVFNALHGLYGEDGRIQSILEALNIPYTGSDVLASAISMDKSATKRYLQSAGIPTAKFLLFNKRFDSNIDEIVKKIKNYFCGAVVVKAASQGSSIGVEIVKNLQNLPQEIKSCFEYCDNLVVEEYIDGKELTCAVMVKDGKLCPMPLVWIELHSETFDFHNKYTKGATNYHCPAPFGEKLTEQIQKLGVDTYRVLGLSGVARIDMMMDKQENVYVLEANTVPGMTETSLVPTMAAAMGISFPELCEIILLGAK